MMTIFFQRGWVCFLLLLGVAVACCAAEAPVEASAPVEAAAPESNPASVSTSMPASMPTSMPTGMRKYIAGQYVLYTDLSEDEAKAALDRLTAMGEMYRRFATGLAGEERGRMPVYLYRRFEDYRRSLGGDERPNAGCYDGLVLRAVLDAETFSLPGVWRVIQHEGWHQFSHRILQRSAPLPLWLEEGLAEYFGAAVWKDGALQPGYVDAGAYVQRDKTIVFQPGRLQRVQARIQTGQFRPLETLATMKLDGWLQQTNALNHDQVWSFVHFLLHADDGQRRKALQSYLADVLQNPPKESKRLDLFRFYFGGDLHKLQEEYETWWLAQPTPGTEKAVSNGIKIPG